MASIYDNIKSAKELVYEVSAHGLSTNMEDICIAQDIFGRSTIGELDALANDIGIGENGMTTGKQGTRATFYSILFSIWHWEDATRFYNQHTNPDYIKMEKTESELKAYKSSYNEVNSLYDEAKKAASYFQEERDKALEDYEATKAKLDSMQNEVIKLKAHFFDLLYKAE